MAAGVAVVLSSFATASRAQVDPKRVIEQFVRPGGIIDTMAKPQAATVSQKISDRPSFGCDRVLSPVGRILCVDAQGAGADWSLNATLWALDGSFDETQKKAFDVEQQGWRSSLDARCGLSPRAVAFSAAQRACVLKAFDDRTTSLRSRLSGDALEETRLSPEDRARIQQALVSRNFLTNRPDGEFGNNTRQAIRSYQNNERAKATGFLTTEQRERLLADARPQTTPPGPGANAPPQPTIAAPRPDMRAAESPAPQNPAVSGQTGSPFVLRVFGERQPAFVIGRIASAEEICAQLRHPLFSHAPSDYGNVPMEIDRQGLGRRWLANHLRSVTQGRNYALEPDDATKTVTNENLKVCLRTIAAEGGNRIPVIARLLYLSAAPGCHLPGADTRTESYLAPSGEMRQRHVPVSPQGARCASWSMIQTSASDPSTTYLMLLTLAEAHPALQALLKAAEETVQAGISARQLEQQRLEEQRRAQEEASRKAEQARREAQANEERQRAAQLAEQKRLAEEKLASMRAVAETKGVEYANRRETDWSLLSKIDEMTDKVTMEAFSIQETKSGVVANVKVRCADKELSLTALIVDADGKPTISLPTTENLFGFRGVAGQIRLNDESPQDVLLLPAGQFRNELDILRNLRFPVTQDAYWRIYVSIPTNRGPIIVKIPLFETQVHKVVKSCA